MYLIILLLIILYLLYNLFFLKELFTDININNKLCCLYAYYEKNEDYKNNFKFFLENGIYNEVDYYIIINGNCSVDIPKLDNIKIFKRENIGYDFGAFSHALKRIDKEYDYYIFLNTSVKGPYLNDKSTKWYKPFLKLFNPNVKLVGTTINILDNLRDNRNRLEDLYNHKGPYTHVQSMFFVIDNEYLNYLKSIDFFNEEKINKITNFWDLIKIYEIGLSQHALLNGWNINCILEQYKDQDYINLKNNSLLHGDLYYPNRYYGKSIEPSDVIFWKTNRYKLENL
jgi:hypothetical protein